MNTLLPISSSLVERIAQTPKSLRSFQSLEYDPTTTVISIVTESLAAHRILDAKSETYFKKIKKSKKAVRRIADHSRIELLRRFSAQ